MITLKSHIILYFNINIDMFYGFITTTLTNTLIPFLSLHTLVTFATDHNALTKDWRIKTKNKTQMVRDYKKLSLIKLFT